MATPHYVTHTESGWHSEPYPSAEAAQAWIDGYRVSPMYKDRCYRVVSVLEYWQKRGYPNGHPLMKETK